MVSSESYSNKNLNQINPTRIRTMVKKFIIWFGFKLEFSKPIYFGLKYLLAY